MGSCSFSKKSSNPKPETHTRPSELMKKDTIVNKVNNEEKQHFNRTKEGFREIQGFRRIWYLYT